MDTKMASRIEALAKQMAKKLVELNQELEEQKR